MPATLTLDLDPDLLRRAEAYAQAHGLSLPALIADYLRRLDDPAATPAAAATPSLTVSPDILALQGSVPLPAGSDWQAARLAYLRQKYEL